jgi:uncharacterized protein (DUF4415 family)
MKRKTKTADRDNPIWKKADFERAKRPEDVLPISIRLSRDVLDHFKRGSPGWQSRIDAALRKIAGLKGRMR